MQNHWGMESTVLPDNLLDYSSSQEGFCGHVLSSSLLSRTEGEWWNDVRHILELRGHRLSPEATSAPWPPAKPSWDTVLALRDTSLVSRALDRAASHSPSTSHPRRSPPRYRPIPLHPVHLACTRKHLPR